MDENKLTEAGFDIEDAMGRLGGDKSLFERLLKMMLDNTSYDEMLAAFDANDVHAAFEAAHALKGVSGNMSMKNVYESIVPLVEKLRADDLEGARPLLQPVKDSYEKALAAIREVVGE